jgi:hypothetical protein
VRISQKFYLSSNSLTLYAAFHALIFQYQNSFSGDGQGAPIQNALGNWIEIWKIYTSELSSTPPHVLVKGSLDPENMWKRVGFLRYSVEYWSLASLILDRISTSTTNQQHPGITSDTGLSRQTALRKDPPSPILDRYDETSMRQVNDLISEFQKARIG